jgi:hypothetical protein
VQISNPSDEHLTLNPADCFEAEFPEQTLSFASAFHGNWMYWIFRKVYETLELFFLSSVIISTHSAVSKTLVT